MTTMVPFDRLDGADLVLERVYSGGPTGNMRDEALNRLLPVGNRGGFRYSGSPTRGTVRLAVLYTSGHNEDWPDTLDEATGTFTYFGDNREPGHELHDTRRRGNVLLRDAFAAANGDAAARATVPPFLLFSRAAVGGQAVRFRGLLVPGSPLLPLDEQLVAVWRSRRGERFQNYRATFTVLNVAVIHRHWIQQMLDGTHMDEAPEPWTAWVDGRAYRALKATSVRVHRTRAEQLPTTPADIELIQILWAHFDGRPTDFEPCAAYLFAQLAPTHVQNLDITRPSRDGGRDAIGDYAIGPSSDPIRLKFALEAKCYRPGGNAIGVREVARLISRIKHREFGVLVTTNYVNPQAYEEVRSDGHNIAFLTGVDIVAILKSIGLGSPSPLKAWLDVEYA